MCYVNYVRENIAFMEYASDERLSASEQLLWHALIHLMNQRANGSDWPEGFVSIPNARILFYAPFGEDTLTSARNRLKQRGLIDYVPGKKNKQAPQYKMIYFSAELSTDNAQNVGSFPEISGNTRGNAQGNTRGNIQGNAQGNPYGINVNLYGNPNRSPNVCEEDDEQLQLLEAARRAYHDAFGCEPTGAEIRLMTEGATGRDMSAQMLAEAIRQAAAAHASYPAMYVLRLLQDWRREFVFTVEDLDEYAALRYACDGKEPMLPIAEADKMANEAYERRMKAAKARGLRVIG